MVAVVQTLGFRIISNQNNQGGNNQQNNQGNQQQSGYQSHPKQLNGGQYHVFTTSLCKRDQKLHKEQLMLLNRRCHGICGGLSSPLCGAGRIIRPGLTIRVTWLWWWHHRWEVISSPRYSWMEGAVSTFCIMRPSVAWG